MRERIMGNSRFLQVLLIEEVLGASAKMAAEIQGRKDRFWQVQCNPSPVAQLDSAALSLVTMGSVMGGGEGGGVLGCVFGGAGGEETLY